MYLLMNIGDSTNDTVRFAVVQILEESAADSFWTTAIQQGDSEDYCVCPAILLLVISEMILNLLAARRSTWKNMRETIFQHELAETLRSCGWWIAKWPDQAVSRMEAAHDGKMRFALPKPFDLVGCSITGRFVAVECKLVRGPRWRIDERAHRQIQTLKEITERGGMGVLALNFRFARRRPRVRVNRAFLYGFKDTAEIIGAGYWQVGSTIGLPEVGDVGIELQRITGGWRVRP